ncbi:MAG: transcriptional regulator NrdR [Patescibacteria group bacterium]|jgi:transcriptional repressor NrdR
MRCPACKQGDTAVIDSRESDEADSIRRRRECTTCHYRFTTYERFEVPNLMVVKKSGAREMFDRHKLSRGIYKAFEKRNVSPDKIEIMIDSIVREIMEKYDVEIQSTVIGEMVLERIKQLDKVAYIRFASVYREFVDLAAFQEEIKKLISR